VNKKVLRLKVSALTPADDPQLLRHARKSEPARFYSGRRTFFWQIISADV